MEAGLYLGDSRFLRKEVYAMDWELESDTFETHVISVAPFGGPIALVKDTSKLTTYTGTRTLQVYSSAGVLIGEGDVPDNISLLPEGLFWTGLEDVVLVSKQGAILTYNMHGAGPSVFEVLPVDSGDRIKMFHPVQRSIFHHGVGSHGDDYDDDVSDLEEEERFQTGLVILCESGRVLLIEDLSTVTMDDVCMLGRHSIFIDQRGMSKKSVTCMTVLNILDPVDTSARVLFGTSDMSALFVCGKEIEDLSLQEVLPAPIMKMAVIPNGGLVACWCSDGSIIVLKENLKERMNMIMNTQSINVPRQMVWVGEDAVMLEWKNYGLLMVGPLGEHVRYEDTGEAAMLVQEIDCCRVLTLRRNEIVKKCSDTLSKTFDAGSTDPPALLFEAWQADANNEERVHDSIRALQEENKLEQAVTDLLAVAIAEFPEDLPFSPADVLQAASYGYGFCLDSLKSMSLTTPRVARRLRLLNTLALSNVGLPLTNEQLTACGFASIVGRLTKRRLHHLALQISRDRGIDTSSVLIHWACVKVDEALPMTTDEELRDALQEKLRQAKNISYRKIARVAANTKRPLLAAMLLDFEPLASNRTNMLLELQQNDKALESAVLSRDTNLVFKTLFAIKSRMIPRDDSDEAKTECEQAFFQLLMKVPAACTLLESYLSRNSTEIRRKAANDSVEFELFDGLLAKLYDYTEQHSKAANFMAKLAYSSPSLSRRLDRMNFCEEMYAIASHAASNQRDGQASAQFMANVSAEHRNLLAIQADLENRYGAGTFVDFSIAETMRKLLRIGDLECTKMVTKMQKDFKVSDTRFWYIKLRALTDRGEWVALRRFASERRSPIGYVPFAEMCIAKGEAGEAAYYVSMVKDEIQQLDLWERLGQWENAMQLAYKLGDGPRLYHIYEECGSLQVQHKCQELAMKMGFGRF
jgi:hypothetical protein